MHTGLSLSIKCTYFKNMMHKYTFMISCQQVNDYVAAVSGGGYFKQASMTYRPHQAASALL